MASEDDKRPETPGRDQWTKGKGDFNLIRCENNKARLRGPVRSRRGVPKVYCPNTHADKDGGRIVYYKKL